MVRFDNQGTPTPEALADEQQLQAQFSGYRGVDEDYVHAGTAALERWWDRKFGIRIHWSLYAITGTGPESWPLTARQGGDPLFREQYEQLAEWWTPSRFDAEAWCDLFTRAGLKYFTFTTKHHDGFSMFDTQTKVKRRVVHTGPNAGKIADCDLHYSITEGPFGRDVVGELAAAAHRRGIGVGFYFSHIDWFDADFRIDSWNYQVQDELYAGNFPYTRDTDPEGFARMLRRHREQIRELVTNYGEIELLSLDMNFPDNGRVHGIRDDLIATVKMARRLQPEMLIRHRGIDVYGDYWTPERTFNQTAVPGAPVEKPWQVIYPGSKHFSHVWQDAYHPVDWLITNLIDTVARGGNFQVGYGPMPDGTWAPEVVRRLEAVGRWLEIHGEGIYATRPNLPYAEGDTVRYTQSKDGRIVYAFLLKSIDRPYTPGALELHGIRAQPGSEIRMLGNDHSFRYTQDEQALRIELPSWFADPEKRPSDIACAFRIEVAS